MRAVTSESLIFDAGEGRLIGFKVVVPPALGFRAGR